MPEWKDITRYGRDDTKRIPRVWSLSTDLMRIDLVHDGFDFKGRWAVYCPPIVRCALEATSGDEAKAEAIRLVCQVLTEVRTALAAAK